MPMIALAQGLATKDWGHSSVLSKALDFPLILCIYCTLPRVRREQRTLGTELEEMGYFCL